ncbi:NAD(P)/FAD-dependent oxidoreductase [Mesorhizobium sp. B2-3-5]|uniref:NAD(P)/FAD-dependent oxidoreductase n=1 Tax=Mesorhizobium sp. B2-3-5 TaxID=2589958 RepID=UPI00112AEDEB|nr:NAD(P)/FAD-dependent oxidoreductase [Mesorhizobium sp. B2-3-5]TPM26875.1 NAD(P)/FAD-dependent oxidoreductase [Mesorhizobium sp. B2-3-5]
MDEVECVVVGAGVIGLAIARALALAGREVLVVEQELAIGTHSSSRNSEVIHAGIYYAPDSLQSRVCLSGRNQLYAYAETRHVPFRRCGKLIVAVEDNEVAKLEELSARAKSNGVDDLRMLDAAEAKRLEPDLTCAAALLSPSTGIVDSHALMLSYRGEAEAAGAMIALGSRLMRVGGRPGTFELTFGQVDSVSIRAAVLINAAGLYACAVASTIECLPPAFVPQPYFARGIYFVLSGRAPFSRLIYPVPVAGGLGTHLTLDLGGQARFGPDVEWVKNIEYTVDEARLPNFVQAIQRYWSNVDPARLHAGYAGIRPKIAPASAGNQDFRIEGSETHGVEGLVNLFGIESPGLTSSLAIAEHVVELLAG